MQMLGPFARNSAFQKGKRKNWKKKFFEKIFYPTKPMLLIVFLLVLQ